MEDPAPVHDLRVQSGVLVQADIVAPRWVVPYNMSQRMRAGGPYGHFAGPDGVQPTSLVRAEPN